MQTDKKQKQTPSPKIKELLIKNNIQLPISNQIGVTSFIKIIHQYKRLLTIAEGKNKFFSLIQYICKLLRLTIVYSIDTSILLESEDLLESLYWKHFALKKMEKSISNGRKIFRFLKFIEDFKKIIKYFHSKDFNNKTIINMIISLFSMFYHILENLELLSNLGVLKRNITDELNWREGKNFFSLLKSVVKLVFFLNELMNFMKEAKEKDENQRKGSIKDFFYSRFSHFKEKLTKKYESFKNSTDNDLEVVDVVDDKENKNERKESKKTQSDFSILSNSDKKNPYNPKKNQFQNEKISNLHLQVLELIMKVIKRANSLKIEPIFSYTHPVILSIISVIYALCGIRKRIKKINEEDEKLAKDYLKNMKSSRITLKFDGNNKGVYMKKKESQRNSYDFLVSIKQSNSLCDLTRNFYVSDEYYDNYYIEFSKDFPTNPEIVFDYI